MFALISQTVSFIIVGSDRALANNKTLHYSVGCPSFLFHASSAGWNSQKWPMQFLQSLFRRGTIFQLNEDFLTCLFVSKAPPTFRRIFKLLYEVFLLYRRYRNETTQLKGPQTFISQTLLTFSAHCCYICTRTERRGNRQVARETERERVCECGSVAPKRTRRPS